MSDVNDAPVYTTIGTTTLTALTEDDVDNSGQLVGAIVGANTADVDAGSIYHGIAVTGLTSGVGAWEFNLNDGSVGNLSRVQLLTTSNTQAANPSTASIAIQPQYDEMVRAQIQLYLTTYGTRLQVLLAL